MFHGRFEHKVDSKGRVQIPISLRKADEDTLFSRFILVRGVGGCLSLFTRKTFDEFVEAFMPDSLGENGTVQFMRQFFSRMEDLNLDNQGRILIPRLLREEADIGDSVLILGAGKWIEIWDGDRYREHSEESEISYDDIARHFFSTLGRKKEEPAIDNEK